MVGSSWDGVVLAAALPFRRLESICNQRTQSATMSNKGAKQIVCSFACESISWPLMLGSGSARVNQLIEMPVVCAQ